MRPNPTFFRNLLSVTRLFISGTPTVGGGSRGRSDHVRKPRGFFGDSGVWCVRRGCKVRKRRRYTSNVVGVPKLIVLSTRGSITEPSIKAVLCSNFKVVYPFSKRLLVSENTVIWCPEPLKLKSRDMSVGQGLGRRLVVYGVRCRKYRWTTRWTGG